MLTLFLHVDRRRLDHVLVVTQVVAKSLGPGIRNPREVFQANGNGSERHRHGQIQRHRDRGTETEAKMLIGTDKEDHLQSRLLKQELWFRL